MHVLLSPTDAPIQSSLASNKRSSVKKLKGNGDNIAPYLIPSVFSNLLDFIPPEQTII